MMPRSTMVFKIGIIFCRPIALPMSSTVITLYSASSCTTRNSFSVRFDSSPVKSGWMDTDDSLANRNAEGSATAITSPT